jgi:hypothetical protein
VSEELEHSLQQAIESYLGKRLGAIDEQLSRMQSDFNEALRRVRENSATESLAGSPLSAAIFAHLQTARSHKLSGAAVEPARPSGEIATIKRAVEDIERQQTHAGVLASLLTVSAQFAERAALFVVRNNQAIGWRVCEASDPSNLEMIGGVSLPLSADTLLGRAAQSRSSWTGAPGSNAQDSLLIDQLGGDPKSGVAVPLVVRERVVAILYADSVSKDPNSVNVDALELLTRVAAMAVGMASGGARPGAEKQPSSESTTSPVKSQSVSEQAPQTEPVYTPEIESQTEAVTEPDPEPIPVQVEPEPAAAEVTEPTGFHAPTASEIEPRHETATESQIAHSPAVDKVQSVAAEPAEAESSMSFAPPPQSFAPPPVEATSPTTATSIPNSVEPAQTSPGSGYASHYVAPLGSARRYGVSEPDLPIEVGEEERRLHNDARRFARLLVSEIKLYNESKVKEGRSRSDIYDRLREDIDRSRQMYDKRVAPPVAARHDYFHQELVNTLAEGDETKLGASYPGVMLSAN